MSAGQTREGPGCVAWWGFSPARDLLTAGPERLEGEVNILLVGGADPRHILKTIGGLRDTDSLHIWALENSMEVVARQLLLLYLALIPTESMGLRDKAEVFLEVFGNAEVRSQTEETLRHVAAQLTLSVTDMPETAATHSCLDTTRLKYKERDELVRIFKRWIQPPSSSSSACGRGGAPFSITEAWDGRVRKHLGERYDSRTGSFDWDVSMKLHKRGCGVIDKQQYVRWREKGLAFEMREGIYQIANPTFLSTRVFSNHKGDKVASRGYWGDIVSSPYLSFGVETEDKSQLVKRDGKHVKTAQDISLVNVQMFFRSLSRRGSQTTTSQPDTGGKESSQPEAHHKAIDIQDLMRVNGISVTFLPLDSLSKLPGKPEYSRFFNTIYFAAGMAHQLDPALRRTAAPGAVLVVELADYLLDLTREQAAGYAERVADMAKDAGFAPKRREGEREDIHAVFTFQTE